MKRERKRERERERHTHTSKKRSVGLSVSQPVLSLSSFGKRMELALSLGENHTSKSFSVLVEKGKSSINSNSSSAGVGGGGGGKRSGYGGMDLGLVLSSSNNNNNNNNISRSSSSWSSSSSQDNGGHPMEEEEKKRGGWSSSPSDPLPPRPLATAPPLPPHQLDLLPFSPVPRPQLHFPWLSDNSAVTCAADQPTTMDSSQPRRPADANRYPSLAATEEAEDQSSPNSALSSFMEFSLYRKNRGAGEVCGKSGVGNGMELVVFEGGGGDQTVGERGTSSRAGSDDDEMNGLLIGGGGGFSRKKLRLSKEQSAFLEDSFKEHHTLNPKQKLSLAKQLNLRPRQVEVWFQNRRARTKLKQTEVDCEYLKRCCETLTDENRRLQKELHELRALKSSQPFFMHLPATTLTMCPSCERVASAPSSAPAARSSSAAQPTAARAAATNGPRPPAAAAGTCAATATAAVCL